MGKNRGKGKLYYGTNARRLRNNLREVGTNPRKLGTNPRKLGTGDVVAARLARLPYEAYLQTEHWRTFRVAVLARSGGFCEGCGVRKATQVHHLNYERVGREKPADVAPLCTACHGRAHGLSVAS